MGREKEDMDIGLVQVYTGDGKGKTTAAIGLAVRALGRGKKVTLIQFLKGTETGEIIFAKKNIPGLKIFQFNSQKKFFKKMNENEKQILKEETEKGFNLAMENIRNSRCNILILDEIINALNNDLIKIENILEMINSKPRSLEIVLTGRNAPDEIIEAADLVTDMKKIKHPYDSGIPAREGIEK